MSFSLTDLVPEAPKAQKFLAFDDDLTFIAIVFNKTVKSVLHYCS